MEQAARKTSPEQEPTKEELVKAMHPLWRYNQHGANLNVDAQLGAVGKVSPETKHEPDGEWKGEARFNPKFYQLVDAEKGEVSVTVNFRHLPSRPVAQANVENAIATVYLGPVEAEVETESRNKKVG